jgi:HK97 family phage prohead protease
MDEKRALQLLGSPERRIATGKIEVRAMDDNPNTYCVRGYASVAEHPYEVYGGPERGGWIETVKRGAFDVTLAANPDVCFLLNHEGAPLARTRSGTLALRSDNTGLESEAIVDRRDPEGQALEVKMERGDLDQMSFGFRVTRQQWNEDYTERDIVEVNLAGGDVSVVNWPANPATSMSIVSARSALTILGEMELAELRSELGDISPDELRAAHARLAELVAHIAPATKAAAVEVDVVPVIRETTREGLAIVARELLGALLDADADEQRVDGLIESFRVLSATDLRSDGGFTFNQPTKVIDEETGQSIADIVAGTLTGETITTGEPVTLAATDTLTLAQARNMTTLTLAEARALETKDAA